MPSHIFAVVHVFPIVFSAVVIRCDSFNDAATYALFEALADVTFGHGY
jgi:hypothetical protein